MDFTIEEKKALVDLRAKVDAQPLHMPSRVMPEHEDGPARIAELEQQFTTTVDSFLVTLHREEGHPNNESALHLMVRTETPGTVPSIVRIREIAGYLGFAAFDTGKTAVWIADYAPEIRAVHVVQTL